jgi:hypothetical protein
MFKIIPIVVSIMLAGGATVATQNSVQHVDPQVDTDLNIESSVAPDSSFSPYINSRVNVESDTIDSFLSANLVGDAFVGVSR